MFSKRLYAVLAGILTAILLSWLARPGTPVEEVTATPVVEVQVTTAAAVASTDQISLVGSVRSFSEAAITAERGGKVTSVPVVLGQAVRAGQVIATLENASERAAVLQAEGAYDAAVAAAAQSDIGPAEAENELQNAKNNAISALRTAYSTADTILHTNIDPFYADPDSAFLPGLRLDGRGSTAALNQTRISYNTTLPTWQTRVTALNDRSDFTVEIAYADEQLTALSTYVTTFITVLNDQTNFSRYSEAELRGFATTFGTIRNNLITLQGQLRTAAAGITRAQEAVTRANLAATGGTTSAADAQIKQALGALRAAQATLAKTILRSPVSGTINELPVTVGDFIGGQGKVAQVANNNTLEVVTFASDAELFALQPGDSVLIAGRYDGVITTIAPAVDSATGKTEVRIAADEAGLTNGDTVRITGAVTVDDLDTDQVRVPLTAVKFERQDGFMFRVTTAGTLEKFPISYGAVFGTNVLITEGLALTDAFVVDARGLRDGAAVTVVN